MIRARSPRWMVDGHSVSDAVPLLRCLAAPVATDARLTVGAIISTLVTWLIMADLPFAVNPVTHPPVSNITS